MTISAVLAAKGGEVTSVTRDQPVTEVIGLLADKRIGAVPVTDADGVAGIFSERDVLYGLRSEGAAFLERRVGDVMTAPTITATPDMPVLHALALMTRRRVRHLPILESGGAMIGFISIGDLVKHRIGMIEAEAEAMRSYIQGS